MEIEILFIEQNLDFGMCIIVVKSVTFNVKDSLFA